MAAYEMFDVLPYATPDKTEVFSVCPTEPIIEKAIGNQVFNIADDLSMEVISGSDQFYFQVELRWKNVREEDAGTILQFFYDDDYGKGVAQTFYWDHPLDGHRYVVQFGAQVSRSFGRFAHKVEKIVFFVSGKVS